MYIITIAKVGLKSCQILNNQKYHQLLNLFYFRSLPKTNFATNYCENIHLVSSAGIQTHDLLIVSLRL